MIRWLVFLGPAIVDTLDADTRDDALALAQAMHGRGATVRSRVSYELSVEESLTIARTRRVRRAREEDEEDGA